MEEKRNRKNYFLATKIEYCYYCIKVTQNFFYRFYYEEVIEAFNFRHAHIRNSSVKENRGYLLFVMLLGKSSIKLLSLGGGSVCCTVNKVIVKKISTSKMTLLVF